MGRDNVDDTRLFRTDEAAARAKMDQDREEILATSPEDAAKGIESLLTPADAAALRGELAEYLTASEQDGLAPGSQGWWDGNCLVRPWGFDLAGITVPVLLLHGRQDMFVPFSHGEWLAAHIPGVEARLLDEDGHLTLMEIVCPKCRPGCQNTYSAPARPGCQEAGLRRSGTGWRRGRPGGGRSRAG